MLIGQYDSVWSLDFYKEKMQFASGSSDRSVRLFDLSARV